jgi:hypothetical protein
MTTFNNDKAADVRELTAEELTEKTFVITPELFTDGQDHQPLRQQYAKTIAVGLNRLERLWRAWLIAPAFQGAATR